MTAQKFESSLSVPISPFLLFIIQAQIDVFQAQKADIQKESFEFRKTVVIEGNAGLSGAIRAEKIKAYFDRLYNEKTTLLSSLQMDHDRMVEKQKSLAQVDVRSRESGLSFSISHLLIFILLFR